MGFSPDIKTKKGKGSDIFLNRGWAFTQENYDIKLHESTIFNSIPHRSF